MVIGVDIGGSFIKALAWDNSKIRGLQTKTPQTLSIFKHEMTKLIQELSAGTRDGQIGVGVAGIVQKGLVVSAPNLPFLKNFQLQNFLKSFGGNIILDNDARCFLRAELALGSARKYTSCLALTLGTGLGGAICHKGRLLPYPKKQEQEIGHLKYQGTEYEDLVSLKYLKKNPGNYQGLVANLIAVTKELQQKKKFDSLILGGGLMADSQIATLALKELRKIYGQTKVSISSLGLFAGSLGAALLLKPGKPGLGQPAKQKRSQPSVQSD